MTLGMLSGKGMALVITRDCRNPCPGLCLPRLAKVRTYIPMSGIVAIVMVILAGLS